MGNVCRYDNSNMYFVARKQAAEYDETLYSREGASEKLGLSISTLADYELGNTKIVPVDKVVLMSDLYRCPELKNKYCKHECPIGASKAIATEVGSVEKVALDIVRTFDYENMKRIVNDALKISEDGKIDIDDAPYLEDMCDLMTQIEVIASGINILAEKLGVGTNDKE